MEKQMEQCVIDELPETLEVVKVAEVGVGDLPVEVAMVWAALNAALTPHEARLVYADAAAMGISQGEVRAMDFFARAALAEARNA